MIYNFGALSTRSGPLCDGLKSPPKDNEDKAPCPRALLPGPGSNRGPPVWKSYVLTAGHDSSSMITMMIMIICTFVIFHVILFNFQIYIKIKHITK